MLLRIKNILFLLLVLFSTAVEGEEINKKSEKKSKKHDLAICAIFRDEAPWIKEWIEFHKLVGVQHFYLYNNLSKDNYMAVLKPYIDRKEVTLFDWPYETTKKRNWTSIQIDAYTDCVNRVKKKTTWLAILDLDEFLFPVQTNSLVDFLKGYEEFGAVGVNWQYYGTSGVKKIPQDKLMIETLVMKAVTDEPGNKHIKSILQPKQVLKFTNPHCAVLKKNSLQVNANKQPFKGALSPHVLVDKIRINHYWSRDEEYFFEKKVARREGWQDGGALQIVKLFDKVEDKAIFRFVGPLRQKMGKG